MFPPPQFRHSQLKDIANITCSTPQVFWSFYKSTQDFGVLWPLQLFSVTAVQAFVAIVTLSTDRATQRGTLFHFPPLESASLRHLISGLEHPE